MRYRHLIGLPLLGLLSVAQAQDENAPALEQRLDLTTNLQARSDQRSQAFNFGGQHTHRFEVEEAGRYTLGAETLAAFDARYWLEATLRNAQGEVLLDDTYYANAEPWSQRVTLEPGVYTLTVKASEQTDTARKGNRFMVTVSGEGLAQKAPKTPVLSRAGSDLSDAVGRFSAALTQGVTTLTGDSDSDSEEDERDDSPERDEHEQAPGSENVASAEPQQAASAPQASEPSETESQASEPQAAEPAPEETFSRVVADVSVNYQGEALDFTLQAPGRVRIYTTSLVSVEKNYKVEARLRDAQGKVVAQQEGERFAGDIDMRVDLTPGRYSVWVDGHRYGSAHSGMQNYALNVERVAD